MNHEYNDTYVYHMECMVNNSLLANQNTTDQKKLANTHQETFYTMVQVAKQPLYSGCTLHSELYSVVRLLNIKSDYNYHKINSI